MAALLHHLHSRLADRLGGALIDLAGGIHIAHYQHIGGCGGDHISQTAGVAEVITHSADAVDTVGHQCHVVTAVVVDQSKLVGLHSIHDLLDVGVRELLGQIGGEHTGQRLGHHHTVGTGSLIGVAVLDEECGGLFQHGVHHVGLLVAVCHGLAHIHETASQREGADDAGEHGTIGDHLAGLGNGIDIDTGTAYAHCGHCQCICLVLVGDDGAHHGGDLVIADADLGAEALGLHGQIHQAHGGAGGNLVGHHLHALGLILAAGDQVTDGDVHQLHGGERQNGNGLFGGGGDGVSHPLFHIALHERVVLLVPYFRISAATVAAEAASEV